MIALSWHTNHVKRRGAAASVCDHFKQKFVDVLFKSLPFAFAWQWSQFTYEVFLHAAFDSPWPFATAGVRVWIFYSLIFSLCAVSLIPVVKADGQVLRSLDQVYAYSLLKQDKQMMREQATVNELFVSLFSIGTGWAFSKTANAECMSDYTPTCPKDLNWGSFWEYFIIALIYVLLACFFFHRFMASYRFAGRAGIVKYIESGRADELFKEIDIDADGQITKVELDTFLKQSGLDTEIFDEAFAKFESESVDTNELVQEFTVEMDGQRKKLAAKKAAKLMEVPGTSFEPAAKQLEAPADGEGPIEKSDDIAHYSNPIGNSEEEHAAGTSQLKQDAAPANKIQGAISDDETGAGSSSLAVRTVFKNRQAKKEAARAARRPQGVDAVIPEL